MPIKIHGYNKNYLALDTDYYPIKIDIVYSYSTAEKLRTSKTMQHSDKSLQENQQGEISSKSET